MKKVLGIGNALVDMLVKLPDDKLLADFNLERGSMTLVDKASMLTVLDKTASLERVKASGGSAANTIHGVAKLDVPAGYIGKIGADEYGAFFASYMEQNNICPALFKGSEDTGISVVLISEDLERTFTTHLGAAIQLSPDDLTPEQFQGYDYFHLEGYLVQNHALVKRAVELARNAGASISIDMASFNVVEANLEFLTGIVDEYIDIVFANEEEAQAFTGESDPEKALTEIAKRCKIAIVKIGKKGSWVASGAERHRIEVIKAKAIDTTGAGDLYASGFLYGLANGYSLDICGKIGSITSGKIVEVMGAKMDDERWLQIRQAIAKLL